MARISGYVSTSSTSEAKINATTYTEQTSGAQRSIKSNSVNDASAGTGARTVRLTYFTLASDGTVTGPFSEVLTLNGTTAVATVNNNIALIEKMEVVTVGSGGVAAGTVSLYTDNAGAGSVIASIAAGDRQTFYAVKYISSTNRLKISDIQMSNNSTGANAQTQIALRSFPYGVVGAAEKTLTGALAAGGAAADPTTAVVNMVEAMQFVLGPARVQAYVTPRENSSQITKIDFGCFIMGSP